MSYEVVYTSSRRGLRGGSRGFCTVAATTGIPRELLEKLESISGYRHAGDDDPVNYSHLILHVQHRPYHVLSRIAAAGVDYSGRGNKIAHHLALSPDEVRKRNVSPDTLLADPGFWITAWDREPQQLPAGRLPSPHRAGRSRCQTWQRVFGDAGWAGLLGRSVQNGLEPVSIIVPTTTGDLALVSEALQLVPAADRWRVCFSTYFARNVAGGEYHWRFVLDGTDEAQALRSRPMGVLIDSSRLSSDLPDDDPFVIAARNGDVSALHARSGRQQQPEQVATRQRPITRSQQRRREAGARARRARLGVPARPVMHDAEPPPVLTPMSESVRGGQRVWWLVAAGVIVVGVVGFLISRL